MITFYLNRIVPVQEGVRPQVVADDGERAFSYLANTKLWHHNPRLEVQIDSKYYDYLEMTRIAADQVQPYVDQFPKMDGRGLSGSVLKGFKAQPADAKVTSAELGLVTQPHHRPLSGEGIRQLLVDTPVGQARVVARYPVSKKGVANNLVYEINNGLKKSLTGLNVTANTHTDGDHIVVQLHRAASVTSQPTQDMGRQVS